MHMISKKDLSIGSTTGVAIAFTKNEPRYVPECVRAEAIIAGCLPVNMGEDDDEELTKNDPVVTAESTPEDATALRDGILQNAIRELIARNDESKFKADKTPRVDAVREVSGLDDITAEDVAAAFVLVTAAE